MYCPEIAICRPLHDPDQVIERLKAKVAHSSPELQQAILKTFLWSARCTLDHTARPASRGDISIDTGCLARAIHCLVPRPLCAQRDLLPQREKAGGRSRLVSLPTRPLSGADLRDSGYTWGFQRPPPGIPGPNGSALPRTRHACERTGGIARTTQPVRKQG